MLSNVEYTWDHPELRGVMFRTIAVHVCMVGTPIKDFDVIWWCIPTIETFTR